jgi:predicted Zn-dependent protease
VFEVSPAILNETARPLPASAPSGLRSIIDGCLAKDPQLRYRRASDLRTALEGLRKADPSPATLNRRLAVWAVTAVAIAAAVTAVIVLLPRATETGPLTSTGAPASPNQEANEAFELAMSVQRVQSDVVRGQQLLERAIALDPHFVEALRYHAIDYALTILNGNSIDTSTLYKAEQELQQVSREAPGLVSLPSALTAVYLIQGRRELAPTDALNRVLVEHPSHRDTIFWRAVLFWLDGDSDAVKQLSSRVLQREPLWGPPRMFLGDTVRMEGDVQSATRQFQNLLDQAPDNVNAVRLLAMAYMDADRPEQAHQLLESKRPTLEKNYMWRLVRAVLLAREGRHAEAIEAMDENTLKFAGAAFPATLDAAEYYALMGDAPKAVEWVERAVRNGDERVAWFQKNPRLAAIRQDPGFQRIIDSVNARRAARGQR